MPRLVITVTEETAEQIRGWKQTRTQVVLATVPIATDAFIVSSQDILIIGDEEDIP